MRTEESVREVFKGVKQYTTPELRHKKRHHATQAKYISHISFGPLLTSLNNTGLLPHFLKFLHDYNWLKGNFCKGQRRLRSDWGITDRTVSKFFLCLYYLEVIEPFGLWKKDRSKGVVLTPMWELTDKLFKIKPEAVYFWTEKLRFGRRRYTHKTTTP
jgi:hypothetical protein